MGLLLNLRCYFCAKSSSFPYFFIEMLSFTQLLRPKCLSFSFFLIWFFCFAWPYTMVFLLVSFQNFLVLLRRKFAKVLNKGEITP